MSAVQLRSEQGGARDALQVESRQGTGQVARLICRRVRTFQSRQADSSAFDLRELPALALTNQCYCGRQN
jgi:hypothetical protein